MKGEVASDAERKSLVWDIRKLLFTLLEDELFQVAKGVGPVPGRDRSKLFARDSEGCFEYINAYMYSDTLLDSEDMGVSSLLFLKDMIDDII